MNVNVLKNCPAISIPLAMLFNRSFNKGYLPQDWRDANICPIHKRGDRAQAMNLTSVTNESSRKADGKTGTRQHHIPLG